MIAEPRNSQQHRGNRCSRRDGSGNVIERGFGEVKQWRGIAIRYNNLGLTYRAGTVLRTIIRWPNQLLQRRSPATPLQVTVHIRYRRRRGARGERGKSAAPCHPWDQRSSGWSGRARKEHEPWRQGGMHHV